MNGMFLTVITADTPVQRSLEAQLQPSDDDAQAGKVSLGAYPIREKLYLHAAETASHQTKPNSFCVELNRSLSQPPWDARTHAHKYTRAQHASLW